MALVNANSAWTADRSFEPAPNSPVPVGSTPTTVTNADFNADGKMDLAAQNSGSNTVSVRLGNGDGTFQAKPDVAVGSTPTAVIGADLNDDGKPDLAVSNQTSNSVTVRLGNGDGTFPVRQDFPAGSGPTSVISADFNRDGYVDLAVANYYSNSVSVLLGHDANGDGKADGTFQNAGSFSVDLPCGGFCIPATAAPNQVISADFNGDARPDLATANLGSCPIFCTPGGVSVLLGNGNGTFQNARLVMSNVTITSIDTNSSGDIMATKYDSNAVSVLRSNGNGTFSAGPQLQVASNPSAVTSEDLDGDARADLAVSNFTSDNVSVLFNDGSGGFTAAQNFAAGDGPAFVIGTRLNADDSADLAVANQNSNNVSVLLNTVPAPETTITKGPPDPDNSTSATFEFSSSEPGSTYQCSLDDPSSYSPCTSPETVPDSGSLSDGPHTFYVKATGTTGNNTDPTPAMYDWRVDTIAPTISNVSPADRSQNVPLLATNVEATLSEDMDPSTLTTSTFTLIKQGSSTPVGAQVSYDSASKKATLNPGSDLEANTSYTARVTGGSTGAKDPAGNALAQDRTWSFTTAAPPPLPCTRTGTANAETISGTSEPDVICAGGGNDTIKGLGGNDVLKGEAGNDKLLGGVGDDTLDGGLGTDTASYSASLTAVNASLATNSSTGEGSDTFVDEENLLGSSKADTLTGSSTNNKLTGGGGNDTERGGSGNDTVIGSGGSDTLKGEGGADTVNSKDGVNGNDSLDGGTGTDTRVTDTTEKSLVGFP
jgi:Bacterial Ig-like domain/FG-GAP-like repeat/RTX calcium-binding nonapeptide repeat (4 copies)